MGWFIWVNVVVVVICLMFVDVGVMLLSVCLIRRLLVSNIFCSGIRFFWFVHVGDWLVLFFWLDGVVLGYG